MKNKIIGTLNNGGKILVHKKVCSGNRQGKPVFERGVLLETYGEGFAAPVFSGEKLKIGNQYYAQYEIFVMSGVRGILESLGIA